MFCTKHCNGVKDIKRTLFYKLLYIGLFSFANNTKENVKELHEKVCENYHTNIVFSLFKTGDLFPSKDCLRSGLNLCGEIVSPL